MLSKPRVSLTLPNFRVLSPSPTRCLADSALHSAFVAKPPKAPFRMTAGFLTAPPPVTLKTGMDGPRKTRKDAKRWSCDFGGIHPMGESINLPKCFFFRVFRVFRGLHRRI